MGKIALFLSVLAFQEARASLNLDVTIERKVGSQVVATSKTISTNYNQDVVITDDGLKNKIILKLKKFSNINVNGAIHHPVQIDLKMIDDMKKLVGKPQTITSFYQQSAQFKMASNGLISDASDVKVSLNFREIN